ncbi:unnamed protein product [Miscanthus lutarioriparius]|uniref:DNA-binding protein BIN4 n=1 Tax=Miscanthus lutarioriparius TaxID=422564 RepID=A0A811Q7D4_9POAL|nr:unnamed protein product [Miscanthus lutarioriparius]
MGEEEDDPDWLRAFQAPSVAPVMLSSGSDDSREASPTRTSASREQDKGEKQASPDHADSKKDMVTLSSGSDASWETALQGLVKIIMKMTHLVLPRERMLSKLRLEKQRLLEQKLVQTKQALILDNLSLRFGMTCDTVSWFNIKDGDAEDDMQDKLTGNSVSQRLPLIFPDKVQRSKALIECDGDSIDLSGDIGAVGRIVVSNGPTGNQDLLLDLKGTIYKTTIVPSRTFCVVSVGQLEAKIEAIMNDFIQLEPQSNLFEAETMMEGTLDGFTFDSDKEGDKFYEPQANQNDQNNEDEGQPKAKTKRKAEKTAGKAPKKAKVTGKGPKKGARKTQPTKRGRKAKK